MSFDVANGLNQSSNHDIEIVDRAFAFIYNECDDNNPGHDPEMEHVPELENIDVVLDEHFSFLHDIQDKQLEEPIYINVPGKCSAPNVLDIRITNEGTNILNGNTIINVPADENSPDCVYVDDTPEEAYTINVTPDSDTPYVYSLITKFEDVNRCNTNTEENVLNGKNCRKENNVEETIPKDDSCEGSCDSSDNDIYNAPEEVIYENCVTENSCSIQVKDKQPQLSRDGTFNIQCDPGTSNDIIFSTLDKADNDSIAEAENSQVGLANYEKKSIPLEIVTDSTVNHIEKLLSLDKEVENLENSSTNCDDQESGIDSETDCKAFAEAVNPEIMSGGTLDNSSESISSIDDIGSMPSSAGPSTSSSHLSLGIKKSISEETSSKEEEPQDKSFTSAVGRAIRRSMRRMKQIRLSGRRSKRQSDAYAYYNEGVVSEETEVRREVPTDPSIGLPSVRSPSASAVLIPSIMASLDAETPREVFPQPEPDARDAAQARTDSSNGHTFDRLVGNRDGTEAPLAMTLNRQNPEQSERLVQSEGQNRAQQSSRNVQSPSREADSRNRNGRPHSRTRDPSRNCRTNRTRALNSSRNSNGSSRNVRSSRENLVNREPRHTRFQPALSPNGSSQVSDDPAVLNNRRRSTSRQWSSSDSIDGFIFPQRDSWPHTFSCTLASLPLTLNLFNISRFAVFSAKYGWQFPIQWAIISLFFGIPLMTFQMSVGQLVGAGPIDMWVISPIFQGIGYGLLIGEALMGVYCSVPIAWLFTYFRESFDMRIFRCITSFDCKNAQNLSAEINEVVPEFFVSKILARPEDDGVPLASLGSIQFNLAFNLVLIWVIIFLALSRGAKSLGKICFLSTLIPFLCFIVVCCYLMYIAVTQIPLSNFKPIFFVKQSWMAAFREAFLVWALHGAALQQLAAGNKKGHSLWRDTTVVVLLTSCGLFLASFCGIFTTTILESRNLQIVPSSFETPNTRQIIEVANSNGMFDEGRQAPLHDLFTNQDVCDNFYVGIRIRKQFVEEDLSQRSGYNSIRFITEMFPMLLFALNVPIVSYIPPFFYISLLLFGLAYQISLWYAVMQGVLRVQYSRLHSMQTFLTFCCCVFGFSAALPLVTGAGIHILYFLDFLVGSAWWIMILHLIQVFGVLLVRGKPFSATDIAKELFGAKERICSLRNAISLAWTVLVPVGLVVATISSFQAGNYRQIFTWECDDWPTWVCQLASGLQLLPLLLVPVFGFVQTCIFLSHPRHSLLQKIEFLYRPPPYREQLQEDDPFLSDSDEAFAIFRGELANHPHRHQPIYNDPPPKYTPPPSYSTATGSSLAKSLENTLRRSLRLLRGNTSSVTSPPYEP